MRRKQRKGFTLIELMVAMALTIFIMVILTEAFVLSIDTFSGLKGIGDMQENLRAGSNALRFDLGQNHFEGMVRTSDPGFANQKPREGFVAIYQGCTVGAGSNGQALPQPSINVTSTVGFPSAGQIAIYMAGNITVVTYLGITPTSFTGCSGGGGTLATGQVVVIFEGVDGDGMPSFRATNQVLHLACRLKGNQQQSFYSTLVNDPTKNGPPPNPPYGVFFNSQTFYNMDPAVNANLPADATLTTLGGPIFRSQWAEVAYFLAPQGTSEEPLVQGAIGTPLYGLYRAQFVAVTDATNVNGKIAAGNLGAFAGLSCLSNGAAVNPTITFFTPNDLAQGAGSRTFTPTNPGVARTWPPPLCSLVVPNVLSFQVQGIVNSVSPQDISYDSALASQPVAAGQLGQPNLKGVSITIRVWDNKTRQTRQISIMQDL